MSEEKDNAYSAPPTGHVWDDNLQELTNPPPRWWMIGLHASWIFVVVYGLIYPMVPLIDSHTKGLTGWTSIGEYKEGIKELDTIRAPFENQLSGMTAKAVLADNDLKNYTVASVKVLFGDNCAACHGSGGQGNPGFPVLADDDWLYGGMIEKIEETIKVGRRGMMPAHGSALNETELTALTRYVAGMGQGVSNEAGKKIYMAKGCLGCHGMDGKGMQILGSANLTDAIWRFSGTEEGIRYTIEHGVNAPNDPQTRNAEMPAFSEKLTATEIKKLAVYVYQLGGGQ